MAAHRSRSVGGEHRRKDPPRLRHETVSELKNSYDSQNLRWKSVAPMFLDLRGNAMSVKSIGHIHHPCNLLSSWRKWARLVELLLESATFGLRNPLNMTKRDWFSGLDSDLPEFYFSQFIDSRSNMIFFSNRNSSSCQNHINFITSFQ